MAEVKLDFSKLMALRESGQNANQAAAAAPTAPNGILEAPPDTGALDWNSEIGEPGDKAPAGKEGSGQASRKYQIELPKTIAQERDRLAAMRIAEAKRINQSQDTRRSIMKAVNAGNRDYRALFLQAIKTIAEMTGDTVFYKQIRDKVGD